MSRKKQITLTVDEDLVDRVDELARDEGTSRSAVIGRVLRAGLPGEEWFHRTLENPLVRALHERLTSSPGILKALAAMVDEQLSAEDIRVLKEDTGPRMRDSAKRRKTAARRPKGRGRPRAEGA